MFNKEREDSTNTLLFNFYLKGGRKFIENTSVIKNEGYFESFVTTFYRMYNYFYRTTLVPLLVSYRTVEINRRL